MARPRRVSSKHCVLCRRTTYVDADDRQAVAEHRVEHRRADRRRASWRAYGERQRERARGDAPDGWLHNLGCNGKHYLQNGECRPIAVRYVTREVSRSEEKLRP